MTGWHYIVISCVYMSTDIKQKPNLDKVAFFKVKYFRIECIYKLVLLLSPWLVLKRPYYSYVTIHATIHRHFFFWKYWRHQVNSEVNTAFIQMIIFSWLDSDRRQCFCPVSVSKEAQLFNLTAPSSLLKGFQVKSGVESCERHKQPLKAF